MYKSFFSLITFAVVFVSNAQDSLFLLDLENFMLHLKENHPIAMVAQNDIFIADQVIRMAKGNFDPKILGDFDQKFYDGTTYYSTLSTGVKIPTRLGWTVNAFGDWNRGAYINPQENIPDGGLTYLGVSVPLGRGMFTDEQRTQLKQATVAYQQSSVERKLVLNELLYSAGKDFIDWQEQQAQVQIAEELVNIARIRLDQLKENVRVGERAAIDSAEASAQLYTREAELAQRKMLLQQARYRVENYLWDKGLRPLLLPEDVQPTPILLLTTSMENDAVIHPLLENYRLKINQLELERKLKLEQLKPGLTVHYNILQPASEVFSTNYSFRNYKWGATFSMPILLRKERSGLAITRLKMANTTLEMSQKQRELAAKVDISRTEWLSFLKQVEFQQLSVNRMQQVTEAERALFALGESSLFLVNAREITFWQSQTKVIESMAKSVKAALGVRYYQGQLGE